MVVEAYSMARRAYRIGTFEYANRIQIMVFENDVHGAVFSRRVSCCDAMSFLEGL